MVVWVTPAGSVMVTVLPGSAVPLMVGLPSPSVSLTVTLVGALGTPVSSVKLVLPALLLLPAVSVATALTVMAPSLNWLAPAPRSLADNWTDCALPVPVTVLVKVEPSASVKVKVTAAPASAVTVTAPVTAVASALVAPLLTPVPKARVGVVGAVLSSASISACSSLRLSVSEPSLVLAAMAASNVGRLLAVTPVVFRPILVRSATVSAGLAVPSLATVWMALAMRASSLISAMVSTSTACNAPTMSLSKARFCTSVAASPRVAPIAAYCAAEGSWPLASPAAPLASAKMAL